jgi:hypothetical protein
VSVATQITVNFDEQINPLSVSGSTIELTGPSGVVVPCTISFANSDQRAIITPHTPLFDVSTYTLTIDGVTDVAGNPVTVVVTQFDTGFGP